MHQDFDIEQAIAQLTDAPSFRSRSVAIGYNEVDALTHGELDHRTAAYRHVAVACALWNYENGSQEYANEAFASAGNLDDSAIRL